MRLQLYTDNDVATEPFLFIIILLFLFTILQLLFTTLLFYNFTTSFDDFTIFQFYSVSPRMQQNHCHEFIVGFCPFEEFAVDGVTRKCSNIHDEKLRESYRKNRSSFRNSEIVALSKLGEIVSDADRRTEANEAALQSINRHPEITTVIERTEQLINQYSFNDNINNNTSNNLSNHLNNITMNEENLYYLLKIHGMLLIKLKDGVAQDIKYTVCKTCSAFIKEGRCKHGFCKKYAKLREIVKEL